MSSRCRELRATGTLMLLALIACAPQRELPAPQRSRVLRVCADPNNLPFSNDAGEGFENKIAELVASKLEARLEYVWWAQRRGFIRNTLGAGICDVTIGVPTQFELAATTQAYYRSTYVFVTRAGDQAPTSFDDRLLKQKLIGVHLIGDDFSNSPPAHALTARGIVTNVRGYSLYGDYRQPHPPAALVRAVADGDLDIAIAWGPLAGYFSRSTTTPLRLTPVSPARDSAFLPFVFDISMGVARGNDSLRAELDAVLVQQQPMIDRLLDHFGVPRLDRDDIGGQRQ
jgi:mxaJ protein